MISINEAIAITKSNIPPPEVLEYPIEDAADKQLAEEIYAPEPSPRYTNSAMDGYAARWEDICMSAPDSPVHLRIIGESRAGFPFSGRVKNGEAIRISTGAMLATGCDTVIKVENTREQGNTVQVMNGGQQGQYIRQQGEEFQTGSLLMQQKTTISAPQAALLASVGIARVKAFKPCSIAILVTGSELVSATSSIANHQIRDANMIMLKTAIEKVGGNVLHCSRISDSREEIRAAIQQTKADIILCSGGVSVGRHDYVKEAAESIGFMPLFWRIHQKPGKPLYLAKKNKCLLFGLPGNPVSAFMCFSHYVRPVITAMLGLPFGWPTVISKAKETISNTNRRTNMIRVRLSWRPDGTTYCITKAEKQESHMLTSLANADGYIILEPGQSVKPGERIDVYRYDFRKEPM